MARLKWIFVSGKTEAVFKDRPGLAEYFPAGPLAKLRLKPTSDGAAVL
ncbi:MAG: hypothetical protein Q8R28_13460 [Dehalococcoidia bacterium]|nr:hypothetical protein [Dehalococcoidia bacterium]